jgi:hypothetical protein
MLLLLLAFFPILKQNNKRLQLNSLALSVSSETQISCRAIPINRYKKLTSTTNTTQHNTKTVSESVLRCSLRALCRRASRTARDETHPFAMCVFCCDRDRYQYRFA